MQCECSALKFINPRFCHVTKQSTMAATSAEPVELHWQLGLCPSSCGCSSSAATASQEVFIGIQKKRLNLVLVKSKTQHSVRLCCLLFGLADGK